MAITYLKKSPKTSSTDDNKTTGIVKDLLKDIESTKEQGCIDLTKKSANKLEPKAAWEINFDLEEKTID